MKRIHIVGGGITGCSLAYFLKDKYHIILYERTGQLGGLSRTFYSIENIPYQKGIHVLHTNHQWILNIIQRAGIQLERVFYDVAINPLIDFKYYRFPFNEESISLMPWHWKESVLSDINKLNGAAGQNLKEEIINFYGPTIYQIFYAQLIRKMTGLYAQEIDETAWFRKHLHAIDKVVNYYREDTYFPVNQGWNNLFDYMVKGVEIVSNDVKSDDIPRDDIVILTGRPDEFFGGNLNYVGLEVEIDSVMHDSKKPDTIIFPNDVPFYSMTQYGKLFNPRYHVEEKNIIVKEFLKVNVGEPAYPVMTRENIEKYNQLVNQYQNRHIYYCGPLATYKHMSMAESIEDAHRLAGEIKHRIK